MALNLNFKRNSSLANQYVINSREEAKSLVETQFKNVSLTDRAKEHFVNELSRARRLNVENTNKIINEAVKSGKIRPRDAENMKDTAGLPDYMDKQWE